MKAHDLANLLLGMENLSVVVFDKYDGIVDITKVRIIDSVERHRDNINDPKVPVIYVTGNMGQE